MHDQKQADIFEAVVFRFAAYFVLTLILTAIGIPLLLWLTN